MIGMSVSIVPCPSCNSLLLSDTVQCPTCKHILDPERATDLPEIRLHSDSDSQSAAAEVECPDCGEMVRSELVRCWRCGAFLRSEIAETYQKMQDKPSAVTYSTPEGELDDEAPVEPLQTNTETPSSPHSEMTLKMDADPEGDDELDDEAGFELAPGVEAKRPAPTDGQTDSAAAAPPTPAPVIDDVPELVKDTDDSATTESTSEASQADSQESEQSEPETDAESQAQAESKGDDEAPGEADSQADAKRDQPDESAVAHSVATGGDALLDIAMQEEKETIGRRRTRKREQLSQKVRTGFIIFCPNGHQVEVQDRHRAMTGRCPRCKSLFHVPEATWQDKKKAETAAADQAESETVGTEGVAAGKYGRWMADAHLHVVDPSKLKLKEGSLANSHTAVDLGFSEDWLLVASLVKKGGLFGSSDKDVPERREAMLAHLADDKDVAELPVVEKQLLDADAMQQVKVVQPAVYAYESMFAGIEVFGPGRIAVRLPEVAKGKHPQFVSFGLSDFREFSRALSDLYDVQELGADCGVPLENEFLELKCHYSEVTLQVIEKHEFYQADPKFTVNLLGRRCQGCGLVVSEDSRKKERIGGPSGKSIAKAVCPKCKKLFGDISLYGIEEVAEPQEAQTQESDDDAS